MDDDFVKTFVRSLSDFHEFSSFLGVHQTFVRFFIDFRAFLQSLKLGICQYKNCLLNLS